ncbi:hypothetical protein B0J12DRAFT_704771 [Macrophomina phaseolina]|uniref:Uncharacterized protein n=1 Tax=Macrophomina phaseolina TaxID=35725 RepID=A0ABQ8FUG6_9PEZI|nr:hypothetical protein B0J12DRAFT_704771 [Macrophomina phaseolina]
MASAAACPALLLPPTMPNPSPPSSPPALAPLDIASPPNPSSAAAAEYQPQRCAGATKPSSAAAPPPPSPTSYSSPLLRLPPEIRILIYAHLTPPQTLSYPLGPNTAISSLSHRPPPLALLLSCRTLAAEALDHFYRVARFGIMLNPPAPLADPHFQRLNSLPLLRRIRNLGVLLDWDFPRMPGYAATAGMGGYEFGLEAEVPFFRQVMDRGRCADMLRLAKRLVGVLEKAGELRGCSVGWTDLVEGCWEEKRGVLEVLVGGLAKRGVKVMRGDVVALDEPGVARLFEGWEVVGARGR